MFKFKYKITRKGVKLWGAHWDMTTEDEKKFNSVEDAKSFCLGLCSNSLRRERWKNYNNKRWIIRNSWNEIILDLVQ